MNGNNNNNPRTRPNMTVQPRGWEVAQVIQTGRPTIQTSRNADRVRIVNRELFTTVSPVFVAGVTPSAGSVSSLAFGTAATNMFSNISWLYSFARSYDKFRVISIKFVWQPQLPVTTSGVVAMWFDSDPEAILPPVAYRQCSGNMNAKTCMIFEPMEITMKPDQLNRLPQYLTLTGAVAPTVPDTAIVGNLKFAFSVITLANVAAAGAIDIGNLWADYEIEFLNPSNPSSEP